MTKRIIVLLCTRMYLRFSVSLLHRIQANPDFKLVVVAREEIVAEQVRSNFPQSEVHLGYNNEVFSVLNPSIIIAYQIWWYDIPSLLSVFRKNHVPIYHIEHGALFHKAQFLTDGNEDNGDYRSDVTQCAVVACWGKRNLECWLSYGPLQDKFKVTGAPHIDAIYNSTPNRSELMAKLGLSTKDKIVIVTTSLVGQGTDAKQLEYLARINVAITNVNPSIRVIWKPHPVEITRFGFRSVPGLENAIIIQSDIELFTEDKRVIPIDVESLYSCAEAMIIPRSSIVISPMYFNVPLVIFDMKDGGSYDFINYFKSWSFVAFSPAELEMALQKALKAKNVITTEILNTLQHPSTEGATTNVYDDICELASTRFFYEPIIRELERTVYATKYHPFPWRNLVRYYANSGNHHHEQIAVFEYIDRFKQAKSLLMWLAYYYAKTQPQLALIYSSYPCLFIQSAPTASLNSLTTNCPRFIWIMDEIPKAYRWLQLRCFARATAKDRRLFMILPRVQIPEGQFPYDLQSIMLPYQFNESSWLIRPHHLLFSDDYSLEKILNSLSSGVRPIILGKSDESIISVHCKSLFAEDTLSAFALADEWQNENEALKSEQLKLNLFKWRQSLSGQIINLVENNNLNVCLDLCLEILKRDGNNPEALNFIGYLEYSRRRFAEACDYFEKALYYSEADHIVQNYIDCLNDNGQHELGNVVLNKYSLNSAFRNAVDKISILFIIDVIDINTLLSLKAILDAINSECEIIVSYNCQILEESSEIDRVNEDCDNLILLPHNNKCSNNELLNHAYSVSTGNYFIADVSTISTIERVNILTDALSFERVDLYFGAESQNNQDITDSVTATIEANQSISDLFISNNSYSCTAMFRKCLAEIIFPIPVNCTFDDRYIFVIAYLNDFKWKVLKHSQCFRRDEIIEKDDQQMNILLEWINSSNCSFNHKKLSNVINLIQTSLIKSGTEHLTVQLKNITAELSAASVNPNKFLRIGLFFEHKFDSKGILHHLIGNTNHQYEVAIVKKTKQFQLDIDFDSFIPGGHTINVLRVPIESKPPVTPKLFQINVLNDWLKHIQIDYLVITMSNETDLVVVKSILRSAIPFAVYFPVQLTLNKFIDDEWSIFFSKARICLFDFPNAPVVQLLRFGGQYGLSEQRDTRSLFERLFSYLDD